MLNFFKEGKGEGARGGGEVQVLLSRIPCVSFYSIQDGSPVDGATYIQGGCSLLSETSLQTSS